MAGYAYGPAGALTRQDLIFDAGAETSTGSNLTAGMALQAIAFPPEWCGGVVVFEACLFAGEAWYPIMDIYGDPVALNVTAPGTLVLMPNYYAVSVPHLRLRRATTDKPACEVGGVWRMLR